MVIVERNLSYRKNIGGLHPSLLSATTTPALLMQRPDPITLSFGSKSFISTSQTFAQSSNPLRDYISSSDGMSFVDPSAAYFFTCFYTRSTSTCPTAIQPCISGSRAHIQRCNPQHGTNKNPIRCILGCHESTNKA
jgi:hypothetical protein